MDCLKAKELLSAYYDNECSHEEKNQIDEHLKYCRECRNEYESICKLSEQTRLLADAELPESFHIDLMSKIYKIEAEKKEAKDNYKKNRLFYIKPAYSYMAASFMFLILINVFANLGIQNTFDSKISEEQYYSMDQPQEEMLSMDIEGKDKELTDQEEVTVKSRMILPQEDTQNYNSQADANLINDGENALKLEKRDALIEDTSPANIDALVDYNENADNINRIAAVLLLAAFPIILLVLLCRRK